MGVDKIVQLVAVVVAIVVAFVDFNYSGALVAILGIAAAWFIAADDRMRFLVSAIALSMAYSGLNAIPAVGEHITTALGGLSSLFTAGAATVIILGLVDRLKP